MIQDWTASLIHLVFLSIVIYLWKSKSDLNFKIAAILILLACIWGLHWIFISLTKFGGLNFFIAVIATILLSGYVASFYLISS